MRNFYCLLLSIVFTGTVFPSNAQTLHNYFGIKGGIAIPNLTAGGSNPVSAGFSSRLGPDAAIFWQKALTKHFAIVPGVEYVSEGGRRNGFQAFPLPAEYAAFFPAGEVPDYLYANFNNEVKLNYLMLNILAKFNWHWNEASPWTVFAEIGPFAGYLLSAKNATSGSGLVYKDAQMQQPLIATPINFDNSMDIKDEAHKGNVGITGDIGLAYNFTNSRVFIETGGNYGVLNIQKDPANGKNEIGALIARVGFAISLGAGD